MAVGSPWALGGTTAETIPALLILTTIVLVLWAIRGFVGPVWPWRGDAVLCALAGLTLLAAIQLVPLPGSIVAVVSPNTKRMHEQLRPEVLERLPDEPAEAQARPSRLPLSMSPPDTRDHLVTLLALTILYAAARSNLSGGGPLRRMAWVFMANVAVMSMVGLGQMLSSPPGVIYWSIPTGGQVFGPFINRNHFPFIANVSLGLACALLAPRLRGGLGEVLNRPSAFWLITLVVVIAAGVVFSHSRGGIVAALVASAGCLAVWFRSSRRATGFAWVLCLALLIAALASWIGWSSVLARFDTLDSGRTPDEVRTQLWKGGLELFVQYPFLGTGSGTFNWIELSTGNRPGFEDFSAEYAHNEYIEALVEGGVLRFGLTLLLAIAPIVAVIRRYPRVVDRPDAGLLLGGLFGLLTLAAHSFVDFGMHLPAIAVMAVVFVSALLNAADSRSHTEPVPAEWMRIPFAIGMVAAGVLLVWDAISAERAERCRAATVGLDGSTTPTRAQAERAVRLLTEACEARPRNALYQHELGQAHLALALTHPPDSSARSESLHEALRHWRKARDLSPVMAPTHARLGHYRDHFASADPPVQYFERARMLLPTDPDMAYFCGRSRWETGDVPGACADWKVSLRASDRHLASILELARTKQTPATILGGVLPDRPAIILRAAEILFPQSAKEDPVRQEYLSSALRLIEHLPQKTAADWELQARLEAELGRRDQALLAYRRALSMSPRQTTWRMAYAQLLRQTGSLKEAHNELDTVLAQDPTNRAARDLLEVVRREMRLAKIDY